MPSAGAVYVEEARLRQSRAPVAELGAAAMRALERAGLQPGAPADFVVVAVEQGRGDELVADLERVARA